MKPLSFAAVACGLFLSSQLYGAEASSSGSRTAVRAQRIVARAESSSPHALSVTVVDHQGKAVPEATIGSYSYVGMNEGDREVLGVTDSNGQFSWERPKGSPAVRFFVATKSGMASGWGQLTPYSGNKLRIVLLPPAALSGKVVDQESKPLTNAEVSVVMASYKSFATGRGQSSSAYVSGKAAQGLFTTKTDQDGKFLISGLPTNAVTELSVKAKGKAMRPPGTPSAVNPNSLGWKAGQQDITLVVEPAGAVEGKVLAEGDTKPPSATLMLRPSEGHRISGLAIQPAKSATDGSFRLEDVPPGAYSLLAAFGTNNPVEWVAEPVQLTVKSGEVTQGLAIKPGRGGILEIAVIDPDGNKPVPGASVSAYSEGYHSNGDSDSTGIARLRLVPGDYQISASFEGRQAAQSSGTVEANKTNQATVEIRQPAKVKGIVRNPDGSPAAGLSVQIVGSHFGSADADLRTDKDGKFEIEVASRQGTMDTTPCVLIRDQARNLAVAENLEEDNATLELKLAPAMTLAGSAECEGKPVTNVTATLIFWTGRSGMHLPDLSRPGEKPGSFEIPALPPGRKYGVLVGAEGYGQQHLYDVKAEAEPIKMQLEPFELKIANLRLAGQVLDKDDKPISGAYVNINGDGQAFANSQTDSEGRFAFDNICEGTVQLSASGPNIYGSASAEGGDTNVVIRLGENVGMSPSRAGQHKLKGIVKDADGKPFAGAQVAVFPSEESRWVKTDANGNFALTWSLQPWQSSAGAMILVRATTQELAAVEDLTAETTNVTVTLKPAFAITGCVQGSNGEPLAKAEVGLWLRVGSTMSTFDQQTYSTDSEGRYKIKALPTDGRFSLYASAPGRGRSELQVQLDAETNRLELPPFVLKTANQSIAGLVLNEKDKPAAGVNVHLSGDGQPQSNTTTDSKGRFSFKVCEGKARLFANGDNSSAQGSAEGGDTNVTLQLRPYGSRSQAVARRTSLLNKPLPDLSTLEFAADAAPEGKPVLLCLFDVEQRPSRRFIQLLKEKHDSLRERGIIVLGAQAASVTAESLKEWKDSNPLPFALGFVGEKPTKSRWASEVTSLPWMILTDSGRQVTAEGFALDELDSKVKAVCK